VEHMTSPLAVMSKTGFGSCLASTLMPGKSPERGAADRRAMQSVAKQRVSIKAEKRLKKD